ncbi:unnamed protein product, partial [Ectocarpus sp. 4 AP-2014]
SRRAARPTNAPLPTDSLGTTVRPIASAAVSNRCRHRYRRVTSEIAPPPSASGVDAPEVVSFSSSDAPIRAVTLFCKDKAEVTRVINFSSPSSLGRHEV